VRVAAWRLLTRAGHHVGCSVLRGGVRLLPMVADRDVVAIHEMNSE
jgi:hypothetical protein